MSIGVGKNSLGTGGGIGVGMQSMPSIQIPDFAGGGGGFDWEKLLTTLGPILGALGVFGTAPSTDLNYNPSLTPDTANALNQSAGLRAYSGINRQTSMAKTNVGSQYYARGLGRSGAAVGDIAGLNMSRAGAIADIEPRLAMNLAQMLAGIDQRALQQAMHEGQAKQSQWGDLADFGMLLAQALPFLL